jgi:hypothetical protein
MAQNYSLKTFLRVADKALLRRYLASKTIGEDLDWDSVTERKIEPVFDAIVGAPRALQADMDRDFREINDMDSEGARHTIIGEGAFHELDLAETFQGMDSHLDAAFWTFLEHPRVFDVASQFTHADGLPGRSWRKRIDLPDGDPATDEGSWTKLGDAIGKYYREKEGRGQVCHVDHYKREDQLYWFAYPQDHATTALEYDAHREFKRRTVQPAFEVIFVFEPEFGTLDTYVKGKQEIVEDLEEIWGRAIMGLELGPPTYLGEIYKLEPLKRKDFPFPVDPTSGIEDVRVRLMRLKIPGPGNQRITLEANVGEDRETVYRLLGKITEGGKIPLDHVYLSQVELQIVFRDEGRRKGKVLNCRISYPNHCSLKHDPKDEIAREHLVKWGIDVSGHVIPDSEEN